MVDVTLGVFWDRGSRSLYKNVMFCTFFRLRNSQAKACAYLKEICNVGVNKPSGLRDLIIQFRLQTFPGQGCFTYPGHQELTGREQVKRFSQTAAQDREPAIEALGR